MGIMPLAQHQNIEIHYDFLGSSGPVVLFVSGLGMRGEQWTPLSRTFTAKGFRAIQFDNRDVGRSTQLADADYSVADMAQDTLAVLDHAGVDQVHVVGISMGGMIAQEMILRCPERFSKAVLMATWAGFGAQGAAGDPKPQMINPGGQTVTMPDSRLVEMLVPRIDPNDSAAVEAHLRRLYTAITAPGFAEKNAHIIEMVVSFALEQRVASEAIARQLRAVGRFSAWDRLSDVRVPTLVLHGDADPLIPYENGVELSRRIPGARLRTLPNVGHLVPLEAPFETFGAILDFLS
jgi:3-oxoadipate enol-lactonase